ncbi:MAG: transposase [Planctomycetes bacterium]|nr:transposase [Planctomycetota bacterium]
MTARDRERLEKLCRYAGRPAVAESLLVELADGRIGYLMKKRWRDGTTHVVMTKQVLMERLCALVPRPRRHLVTYHGVLAPAAGLGSRVVPKREAGAGDGGGDGCGHAGRAVAGATGGGSEVEDLEGLDGAAVRELLRRRVRVPHAPGARRRRRRRRYSWAELLARVFAIDVWLCRIAAAGVGC